MSKLSDAEAEYINASQALYKINEEVHVHLGIYDSTKVLVDKGEYAQCHTESLRHSEQKLNTLYKEREHAQALLEHRFSQHSSHKAALAAHEEESRTLSHPARMSWVTAATRSKQQQAAQILIRLAEEGPDGMERRDDESFKQLDDLVLPIAEEGDRVHA